MYAWSMMIICVLAFRSTTNLWLAWLSSYVTQYSTYNIYLGPSTTILANAINVQRHDNTKVKSPCFRCPPTACRGGWHRSTMSGCDPTLPGMDRFMNLVNHQYMVTINLQVSDFYDFFCCSVSAANSHEISIYFNKYLFGQNKYFSAYFWVENKYILA